MAEQTAAHGRAGCGDVKRYWQALEQISPDYAKLAGSVATGSNEIKIPFDIYTKPEKTENLRDCRYREQGGFVRKIALPIDSKAEKFFNNHPRNAIRHPEPADER